MPDVRQKTLEGKKMIEPGKLNGYLVAIKEELRKAEGKHPDFCEALLDPESRVSWADAESSIKRHNATSKEYADNVLMEEMAEACAAIGAGDKDHAKQELAQVCAVAIRMMHRLDVNG